MNAQFVKPTWQYRVATVLGVPAMNDLLCRSKVLFFARSAVTVSAWALWFYIAFNYSQYAPPLGLIAAATLMLFAMAWTTVLPIPYPGMQLILTPDFSHKLAQCQLHAMPGMKKLEPQKTFEHMPAILDMVAQRGLSRVLLSTRLLRSETLRAKFIERLNSELRARGSAWAARDDGYEPWFIGDLTYYCQYQIVPWAKSFGRVNRGLKFKSKWGKVYLERSAVQVPSHYFR